MGAGMPSLSYGSSSSAASQNESGVNFTGGTLNMGGGDAMAYVAIGAAVLALVMVLKR